MSYKICQRFITQIFCLLCLFNAQVVSADIDEIKARGKLRVGLGTNDRAPFYYHNKKGELVGLDINTAYALSNALGVEPEFIVDREKWDDVVQDVVSGRIDIACSYLHMTSKRALVVAFSRPYMTIKPIVVFNRLLLIKAIKSDLSTLKQMFSDGKFTLFTDLGSSYHSLATRIFKNIGAVISPGKDGLAMQKVLSGEGLAYFTNEVVLENKLLKTPEANLHIVSYPVSGIQGRLAYPISYKNPILLSVLNSVIETRKLKYTSEDVIDMLRDIYKEKDIK